MSNASLISSTLYASYAGGIVPASTYVLYSDGTKIAGSIDFIWNNTNKEVKIGQPGTISGGGGGSYGKISTLASGTNSYNLYLNNAGFSVARDVYWSLYNTVQTTSPGQPFTSIYGYLLDFTNANTITSANAAEAWSNYGNYSSMTVGGNVSAAAINTNETNVGFSSFITRSGTVTAGDGFNTVNSGYYSSITKTRTYNNAGSNYSEVNYGNYSSIQGNTTVTASASYLGLNYGYFSSVTGTVPGANSKNYGYYVDSVSGATTNWSFYDASGQPAFLWKLGVGGVTPSALIHLAAGTATAGTGPLKFTTAANNLTVPEAGVTEYKDPDLFFTPASAIRYNLPLVTGAGTQGDLIYASAASIYSRLAKNASATRYLSNTGSSNNPAWAQVDLTNGVTGTLPIGSGGTGATSYGANRIISQNSGNTAFTSNAKFTIDGTSVAVSTTEHSSSIASEFRITDSVAQEVFGMAAWNGGGGTGGYGSVVLSSSGGAGVRLGEMGGKNNSNTFRVCDFIFQTGTAADLGEIVVLVGTGAGAFGYRQYIGANGTAFNLSSAPTAKVHIAAGTTTASSAPIKLTSGSLLTAAEAGAIEYLTNDFYFTQSTNTSRHPVAWQDNPIPQQVFS